MPAFIDLTGMRFGKLVVLRLNIELSKSTGRTYWRCKCDCGNEVDVRSDELLNGSIISCKCYRIEKSHEIKNLKTNIIEFDANLGCYRVYFDNCDEYFLIDIEDKDLVQQYHWYKDKSTGYVKCDKIINGKRYRFLLHRFIMSNYQNIDGFVVDHLNHNPLDNRKHNLRISTYTENSLNKRPINNTGEFHICFDKRDQMYRVYFKNENVNKYFDTLESAIKFRNKYMEDHPSEYYYRPEEDYINRKNQNIIQPFIFINPEERNKNNA